MRRLTTTIGAAALLLACGCAGFAPIRGRDVQSVPASLLDAGRPRTPAGTIDLSLLGQPECVHVIDSGDVLGVYIDGKLGKDGDNPPLTAPAPLDALGLTVSTRPTAEIGYPLTVGQDGTLHIPQLPPVKVRGMTLAEVEAELRELLVGPDGDTKPGREKIIVTLQKPRTVRVTVFRKDRTTDPAYLSPPDYRRTEDGRGSGVQLELPIYENDVLHAIIQSGGLPGQDGENAVRIVRAGGGAGRGRAAQCGPGWSSPTPTLAPPQFPLSAAAARSGVRLTSHTAPAGRFPGGHSVGRPAGDLRPTPAAGHSVFGPAAGPVVGPQPSAVFRSPAFAQAGVYNAVPREGRPCEGPACDGVTCDGATCDGRPAAASRPGFFEGRVRAAYPDCRAGRCGPGGCGRVGCGVAGGGSGGEVAVPFGHSTYGASVASVVQAGYLPGGCDMSVRNPNVTRIPLTVLPGECPSFGPQDVLLHDGDVVLVESRSREFFYTAGLLGGGKYPLPRDEDLDLLDAIALVDGQRRPVPTRAVGGVSSLNQDVTVGASRVLVYRKTPTGEVVPIRVNLNVLKRDPSQSILVLPGDRIFLQYTRLEALAAGFERHFLDGTVLGIASGITFSN